jgi:hypothetical protein
VYPFYFHVSVLTVAGFKALLVFLSSNWDSVIEIGSHVKEDRCESDGRMGEGDDSMGE